MSITEKAKYTTSKLLVHLYFFLFLAGNFPRFVPFETTIGSLNVLEIFFYCVCIVVAMFFKSRLSKIPQTVVAISIIFILSYLIGTIRYGQVPITPLLYMLRIVLTFFSSYIIALHFSIQYKGNLDKLITSYLTAFVIVLALSWAIYIVSPHTGNLLDSLHSLGIIFVGDRHVDRLVSNLFDPNYFGSISVFFMILSLYVYFNNHKTIYIVLYLLILVSIIFTFSRTALVGTVISLFIFLTSKLYRLIRKRRLGRDLILLIAATLVTIIIVAAGFPTQIANYGNRFSDFSNDPSTQARILNANTAIDALKNPLTLLGGVGFNYVEELGLSSLSGFDSSLLNVLVTFGLPLSVLLFVLIYNFNRSLCIQNKLSAFYTGVVIPYLIASFVMSFSENLLFYFFWQILVLPVIFYIYIANHKHNEDKPVC